MTPKQKIKIGKTLCLVLRHEPSAAGVTIDPHGWVRTADLLEGLQQRFPDMTMNDLREIVAEDDKQRYAFGEDGTVIRANQGHSLPVDLQLLPQTPPEFLYHGTARKSVELIWRDGLLPMDRQQVHLSVDRATAGNVGKRHGEPIVFRIAAGDMSRKGLQFFQSANGVWLTDHVPIVYLTLGA